MANDTRNCLVRDSDDGDIAALSEIYAHWVVHGSASFELESPGQTVMAIRRRKILKNGFPYLTATDSAGIVLGYAYAGPYHDRPAYRFACEDSIYIVPDAVGRGVGHSLLSALIPRCESMGMRLMIARIGDSGSAASIRLHAANGFQRAGLLPAVGWKHNRWLDSVLMVRILGLGASSPPATPYA